MPLKDVTAKNSNRENPVETSDNGASISVEALTMKFGAVIAVDDVSIDIKKGEFLALLGPSGSGKSTILMSIAGFEFPTSGRIMIDGEDVTRVPPYKRNIGMVFQNYTLFPHLSVLDNVAFPLKMRRIPKAQRLTRAAEALETVRLGGFGGRMPNQLSGGQQQRVALARALVYKPRVLLMDEPLSALDKNLREDMQLEIKRLHAELDLTIIFVTHDQTEALTMADRVAILKDGRIQQLDTARDLYEKPRNLFSAGFIGEMNFIPGIKADNKVQINSGMTWPLPASVTSGQTPDGPVSVAIRPERLTSTAAQDALPLEITLQEIVYAGAGTLLIGHLDSGAEVRARVASTEVGTMQAHSRITLYCPPEAIAIFPSEGATP